MRQAMMDDWAAFDGVRECGGRTSSPPARGVPASARKRAGGVLGGGGRADPRVVSRGSKWHEATEAEWKYGKGYKLHCPPMPKRAKALGTTWAEWESYWVSENGAAIAERAAASSRAVNCVGLHWLAGTFAHEKLAALRGLLREFFGPSLSDVDYGFSGYDRGEHWGEFAHLVWVSDPLSAAFRRQRGTCYLVVTGQGCDSFTDGGRLMEFYRRLKLLGLKETRLDTFFDDFDKRISPESVERYVVEHPGCVSGFKVMHSDREWELGTGEICGDGVYFGRRGKSGCGKMLRVYDKNRESEGARDCFRWEAEFTGEYAQALGGELWAAVSLGDLRLFCCALGSALGGAVSFLESRVGVDRHIDRRELVSWWASIIDEIGSVPLRVARKVSSVGQGVLWLAKQASGTVAMVYEYFQQRGSPGSFDVFISQLRERPLSQRQLALLDAEEAIPSGGVLRELLAAPF